MATVFVISPLFFGGVFTFESNHQYWSHLVTYFYGCCLIESSKVPLNFRLWLVKPPGLNLFCSRLHHDIFDHQHCISLMCIHLLCLCLCTHTVYYVTNHLHSFKRVSMGIPNMFQQCSMLLSHLHICCISNTFYHHMPLMKRKFQVLMNRASVG